jgi:hypothetical protein
MFNTPGIWASGSGCVWQMRLSVSWPCKTLLAVFPCSPLAPVACSPSL